MGNEQTVPENLVYGNWLSDELPECLKDLLSCGFKIRGIFSDNRSSKVAVLNIFLNKFPGDAMQFIVFHSTDYKTYILLSSVHLVKNIRNNLPNAKKYRFQDLTSK